MDELKKFGLGDLAESVADEHEGKRLRNNALSKHESKHSVLIGRCRDYAIKFCRSNTGKSIYGFDYAISTNDIYLWAGIEKDSDGKNNWLGAVLTRKMFEPIGDKMVHSIIPHNHAALIRVWRLKKDYL